MNRRRAPFPRSVAAAREVLALRDIRTPEEIDLEALLDDFCVTLRRAPIGNAEGRLVRAGRRGVMTIDVRAFDSEKWRFVLAHELGHFLLHVDRDDLTCFPKRGATRDDKSRIFLDEEAASGFAAALLMPDEMVRERYDASVTPMERARRMASTFGVSLPTAALRVLDFTDEPCAVAYAEAGVVGWCTATKAFGVTVPKHARVEDSHGDGAVRAAEAATWGKVSGRVERVHSQTHVLSPFDATVTLLWHDAAAASSGSSP